MIKILCKEVTAENPKLIEECFINFKIMISVWPEDTIPLLVDLS